MPKLDKDITEQRLIDLMKAYRRAAPTCTTQKQAWIRTAESPAPRYYITHFQAYQRMLQYFKGDRMENYTNPYRKALFDALYETCIELSQKPEYLGMSLYKLTQFAITQPAPSFFVSPESMPVLFKKMKEIEREKSLRFHRFYRNTYLKGKDDE